MNEKKLQQIMDEIKKMNVGIIIFNSHNRNISNFHMTKELAEEFHNMVNDWVGSLCGTPKNLELSVSNMYLTDELARQFNLEVKEKQIGTEVFDP